MKTANDWIQALQLQPHPEGGHFARIYESSKQLNTANGKRAIASAIHYLLEQKDFSSWHRIQHDELWFFHSGAPLVVHQIKATGELISHILSQHDQVTLTVTGGTWFCAELLCDFQSHNEKIQDDFSLVSCVVNPGFDFADFELGNKEEMTNTFPQHRDIICRLCRA